jgi:hypothetical protein
MFRSYRPGYAPWRVTAEEARFLIHAIGQTLEVAPRVKEDPDILNVGDDEEEERLLVRVPVRRGDEIVWEDRVTHVPPPEPVRVEVELDAETLARLRRLPRRAVGIEADLFSFPAGFGAKGERPRRPYVLMAADEQSGMILNFEMMEPDPTLEAMLAGVPAKLAELFARAGIVPETLTTRTPLLADLLVPLASALRVELRREDELPAIDAARDAMFGMLGSGGF